MADLIDRDYAIKLLEGYKENMWGALHNDDIEMACKSCIKLIKQQPPADKPCPLYGGNDDKCSICGV